MSINKFPIRNGIGNKEILMGKKCINYYKKKKIDIGYNGYFEREYCKKFVKFLNKKGFADAQATGTLSILSSIQALQLKKGSEILVSPITDPGSLSAIIIAGHKPKLIDTKKNSYLTSFAQIKKRITNKTKCILLVHAAGKAVNMKELVNYCKRKRIKIIEDSSQAHGARCFSCDNCNCKNKVGTFGDISAFSTMNRKAHMTGSTGGVVFTKNKKLYHKILAYSDRGKKIWDKDFNERDPRNFLFPALNLHSNELACAIGLSSLSRLKETIKKRVSFCEVLNKLLMAKSKLCRSMEFSRYDSPFFIPIFFKKNKKISKRKFATQLQRKIPLNPHYQYLVYSWRWIKEYLVDNYKTKNAAEMLNNSFNIFLNENYTKKHALYIVNEIIKLETKFKI
jgi:perosamine synthetase